MTSECSFRIHYSVIEPKKEWYTVVLNMKPTSNSLHRKAVMLFYGVTKGSSDIVYFPFKQANFFQRLLNFNAINFKFFLLSSFMSIEDCKTTVHNTEKHFKECLRENSNFPTFLSKSSIQLHFFQGLVLKHNCSPDALKQKCLLPNCSCQHKLVRRPEQI